MTVPNPHIIASNSTVSDQHLPSFDFFSWAGYRKDLFDKAIELAFLEDMGNPPVDATTKAISNNDKTVKAVLYCKSQPALIAGLAVFESIFLKLDPKVEFKRFARDGQKIIKSPLALIEISGKANAILAAERTALNLLQRMCAVATTTHKFIEKTANTHIAVLDTRKTTPGLRIFEKYAVIVGGGTNHRFGLYDAILIKDNHIEMAGSITQAVTQIRAQYPKKQIEVECKNLDEVKESLNLSVDKILLDNMTPDLVKKALGLVQGKCFIEVSGGINLSTITDYLFDGVNAISVGAITHSVTSIDLSLEIEQ